MDRLSINGYWNEICGKLKQDIATLTNNTLLFKEGMEGELLGRQQKEYGKIKAQIKHIIAKPETELSGGELQWEQT